MPSCRDAPVGRLSHTPTTDFVRQISSGEQVTRGTRRGEQSVCQSILTYSEVLHLVEQLTPEEQACLLVEVRERSQGFGMWRERADLADPELYMLRIREEDAKRATGEPKAPNEYLAESVPLSRHPLCGE
jgi:hypothetical protein